MTVGIFTVSDNLTEDEIIALYVRHVLKQEGGNKTKAAQRLGISRRALYRRVEMATLGSDKKAA